MVTKVPACLTKCLCVHGIKLQRLLQWKKFNLLEPKEEHGIWIWVLFVGCGVRVEREREREREGEKGRCIRVGVQTGPSDNNILLKITRQEF
jgi:hypothetical protein